MELSVPVQKPYNQKPMKEVQIDYRQTWMKDHWMSIQSAYGNAPFFEYYGETLSSILFGQHKFLFDLNWQLLEKILQLLKVKCTITFCENYVSDPGADVVDLRSKIHPRNGVNSYDFFKQIPYNQVFGNIFAGTLSIIDLLFCEGPEAVAFLQNSVPNNRNNH